LATQTFSKRAVILGSTLSTHSTTNNFCIKTNSPVNGYSARRYLAAQAAEEGYHCDKERRCVKIQPLLKLSIIGTLYADDLQLGEKPPGDTTKIVARFYKGLIYKQVVKKNV
jgi:hypothetical protein